MSPGGVFHYVSLSKRFDALPLRPSCYIDIEVCLRCMDLMANEYTVP